MLKYLNHARNRFYTPSIIGSDDIDASRYTIPMLTTVHVPKEEMARSCVKVLLDRICSGHQEIVKVVYGNKLMVRQSCAPVEESYSLEYYI
jgi:sulfate transport system ATP-binding protein/LacI family transcriptional regulator/LacI family repressor for deo operon, udp, cdd, tsx, nupC, and nupG